ncbi:MAG: neutral/alkaline non-lysosomal ceramidase N-terminal domain-containing protein [Candidatus Omnitrophica bacterium]|nr:neutral/alkaline non-lysosomal ceramidase N-terminal domain-containing protein [Candidatus Omnitrophota bacterium]
MKTTVHLTRVYLHTLLIVFAWLVRANGFIVAQAAEPGLLEVGIAARDITPEVPICLAGYSSRDHPAEKVDSPLEAQAIAWRNETGERFVLVAVDNCEVSHAYTAPVLRELEDKYGLKPGRVMILSSHTHSAPILEGTLESMYQVTDADLERIHRYSAWLRTQLVSVVAEALNRFQPARMEYGVGRAAFAMNRRLYRNGQVVFGDNPDGVVDWEVPVLRIRGTNDSVRAVLFGYACHGTSVRTDNDFYTVSGEYMAYARQQIEAMHPGAIAVFVAGMGADADPAPRGGLLAARRHGLELAGAVMGVLDRPMQPVRGAMRLAYTEVSLPFVAVPSRDQLEKDAHSQEIHIRNRAEKYLGLLDQGRTLPEAVKLPLAAVRFGDDLTFVAMGGEVVADYSIRFKRILAADHPWTIGYAYEVPCYIPTARLILEGGYEVDQSLVFYGYYGPFRGSIEETIVQRMSDLVAGLRGQPL